MIEDQIKELTQAINDLRVVTAENAKALRELIGMAAPASSGSSESSSSVATPAEEPVPKKRISRAPENPPAAAAETPVAETPAPAPATTKPATEDLEIPTNEQIRVAVRGRYEEASKKEGSDRGAKERFRVIRQQFGITEISNLPEDETRIRFMEAISTM